MPDQSDDQADPSGAAAEPAAPTQTTAGDDARANLRQHLEGVMTQYDAINEADRRWGEPQKRGIAMCLDKVCMVGLHDDRSRTREVRGTGPSYESAFRDAENKGYVASGSFAGKPAKNPLIRDLK